MSNPLEFVKPYLKSVTGFIAPGVVALVAAVGDASPAGSHVAGPEWVGIGAACILTSVAVFAVPNLPRNVPPAPEPDVPPVG
jgi:hypothetical protein